MPPSPIPTYDAIILGAGAAGLFCAAQAGQHGLRMLLIDHFDRVAEKVRSSGGGRANFTNRRNLAPNNAPDLTSRADKLILCDTRCGCPEQKPSHEHSA